MNLRHLVGGKTVALVGRAGSIVGTGRGPAIDSADVVVRINWVLPIEEDQVSDVGRRTDLVYHCRRARVATHTAKRLGVPTYRVKGPMRKKLAKTFFKRAKTFRPTTGFCGAVELLRSGASEVRLYGFDVFRSGHVQERDPGGFNAGSPLQWSHNPEMERAAWVRLIEKNGKLRPDPVMKKALR